MVVRLARPLSDLSPDYDAVVIGSGYGGGVAAARLARSGQRVAVLERGREFLPGEFPENPLSATKALQVTSAKSELGSATALFDMRLGNGMHVLKGCGLGGTSLINAAVCLTPDERVFDASQWPEAIRKDRLLADGFLLARTMLRPAVQPDWRKLQKVKALEKSATPFGVGLQQVPIHVAFTSGANAANVDQPACTSCGDCCGGCNVGAKTTVANTYLADAAAHGAEIFTETTVRSVDRGPDGHWRVRISAGGGRRTVTTPIVIVAAGTLGTAEILMRSRVAGLALSPQLGERLTSNGDVIALGYNNVVPVNGIGFGRRPPPHGQPVGAAVNALIDLRATPKVQDGIAIVECALPSSLGPMLPAMLSGGDLLTGIDDERGGEAAELQRSLHSIFAGVFAGAVHNTQTYLAIGHDAGDGRIRFVNDRAVIDWPQASSHPVFARIDEALRLATKATGGTYIPNPAATRLLGGNLMSVHPLGGCAMADDVAHGVVNDRCQVFDASSEAAPGAVHEGLYVCDGSVIPCSLGVHPLLTISAVAERAMILMARDRGWQTRRGAPPPLKAAGPRLAVSEVAAGGAPRDVAAPAPRDVAAPAQRKGVRAWFAR